MECVFFSDVPNSGRGLPRLEYRQEWNVDFLNYLKSLDAKKPVVVCGDLNVAHKEIGLTDNFTVLTASRTTLLVCVYSRSG